MSPPSLSASRPTPCAITSVPGLVKPQRSPGNIRLYSESDIEILRRVRSLMDELGVNMAGVEVITNMLEKMTDMARENEKLRNELLRLQKGKI